MQGMIILIDHWIYLHQTSLNWVGAIRRQFFFFYFLFLHLGVEYVFADPCMGVC